MTEALNPELALQLRIASTRFVADDVRSIELVDAEGGDLPVSAELVLDL